MGKGMRAGKKPKNRPSGGSDMQKQLKQLQAMQAEMEQKQVENKKYCDAVDALTEKHDKRGAEADKKEVEADKIKKDQKVRDEQIQSLYNAVRNVKHDVDSIKDEISAVSRSISDAQIEIDSVNGKLSNLRNKMFDAVFNAIDAKKESGKTFICNCNERIKAGNRNHRCLE